MSFLDSQNSSVRQETEEENRIQKFELALNPAMKEEQQQQVQRTIDTYNEQFGKLDMEKAYEPLFELLWYSQMPCFDVKGMTSSFKDEISTIKRCYWKGQPINCASIFQKRPTDRGMCCSFNMKKAEAVLKNSKYTESISARQIEEHENAFGENVLPRWYIENEEPMPEVGTKRGLSLVLDRHTDRLSPMSVAEDFQGFVATIEDNKKYPMTYRNSLLIRPGMENDVELNAIHMFSENAIRKISPHRRKCFFPDEHQLEIHQAYSRSNCIFECKMKVVYNCMRTCKATDDSCKCPTANTTQDTSDSLATEGKACVPWYYPTISQTMRRMCNPWDTLKFQKLFTDMSSKEQCGHCLPDCTITSYDRIMSYAKLPKCDKTNMGSNRMCNLVDGNINPPSWTDSAEDQYVAINKTVPTYVVNNSTRLGSSRRMPGSNNGEKDSYNAFEEDIAFVNIFFGQADIKKYQTKIKMSNIEFISLVGGNIGFALGLSVISVAEIIYWFTVRLFLNYTAR